MRLNFALGLAADFTFYHHNHHAATIALDS